MDKSFITIRMPKELLANWLADLRSGKAAKGVGVLQVLKDPAAGGRDSFCCLGRLQIVAGDETCEQLDPLSDSDKELVGSSQYRPTFRSLPTIGWLEGHGVKFSYLMDKKDPETGGLITVQEEVALAQYPYVVYQGMARSLTELNDKAKYNLGFPQIADIIEAHAEGI